MRIMPGIAIGAYGGVYWEGDHPFNLATWLKKHPQFSAQLERGVGFQLQDLAFPLNFPASDYTMTACPSAPETMDWMTEAVSWLAETFDIGGVNIESGDYGVCGCARCRARRANDAEAARRSDTYGNSWSHTDMASNFPRLYAAAKATKPDLWMYCEMQWDNLLDPVASEAQKRLPRGGIYQHTANKSFWAKLRTRLKRDYVEALPTQPNVLRCQFACQWNGDERTERYALNARTFADMACDRLSRRHARPHRLGRALALSRDSRGELSRLRPFLLGADADLGAFRRRRPRAPLRRARSRRPFHRHRRGDRLAPAPAGGALGGARQGNAQGRRGRKGRNRASLDLARRSHFPPRLYGDVGRRFASARHATVSDELFVQFD